MITFDKDFRFLNELTKPLSLSPRRFVVDYLDEEGVFCNAHLCCLPDEGKKDRDVVSGLISVFAARNHSLYTIVEIISDLSIDDIEKIENRAKLREHVKPLYFNKIIEKRGRHAPTI